MNILVKKTIFLCFSLIVASLLFAQPHTQRNEPPRREEPRRVNPVQMLINEIVEEALDPRDDIDRFFSDYERLLRRVETTNLSNNKSEYAKYKEEKERLEDFQRKLSHSKEWSKKDQKRYQDLSRDLDMAIKKALEKKPTKPQVKTKKAAAQAR